MALRLSAAFTVCVTALPACTSFSADGGFAHVAQTAHARLGVDARWPRFADERAKRDAAVTTLLAQPLEVDDAVQIALLENHELQASFEELGLSEADLVQSGRLPNPRFTLRRAGAAGLQDVEDTLTFNVLSLLTTPYAHGIDRRHFSLAQDTAVVRIAQLAESTRIGYYRALAARESLAYAWQVKDAAETGAELAHRMLSAGNWNRLDQAREQGFYLQAQQQLSQARALEDTARAELRRLLGIADEHTEVRLAQRLPELPASLVEPPEAIRTALQDRLDLRLMRGRVDELAQRLRLTAATRFIDVIDAGPARIRNGPRHDPIENGYELSFEVPLFDAGGATLHRSQARYAQAVDRFEQATVDARTDVVGAIARYRAAFEIAVRQRDDVLPLRRAIADQDLLRYNASLASVFDLLADARERIGSVNEYIEHLRDFWIAKAHLDAALIAGSALEERTW